MPSDDVFQRPDYADELAQDLLIPSPLKQVRSGVFLSGIRRVGKTTFMRQDLIPALEQRGALPIYVDLWTDRSRILQRWCKTPCVPHSRSWKHQLGVVVFSVRIDTVGN